jgi:hypothetical protein
MVIMKIPEKPPSSEIKANEIDKIYNYLRNVTFRQSFLDIYETVGKAKFLNISALLYKLDRAMHSDLV